MLTRSQLFLTKPRYFSTLILGEQKSGKLNPATLATLTAAQMINKPIDILLTGPGTNDLKSSASKLLNSPNTNSLLTCEESFNTADKYCHFLKNLITSRQYTHILAPSTAFAKDYLPRLSGMLNSQAITDIIDIISDSEFKRPIYAGNAIAKVRSSSALKILTIRPTNFDLFNDESSQKSPIEKIEDLSYEKPTEVRLAEFIEEKLVVSDRPELTEAKIVVSGGRALKSDKNFDLLYELADILGNTAVGASRAAVDAGYCPNDMQVGQTGKVVAPDLYIAVGISGAIQHLAGMKDSKVSFLFL